MEKITTKKKEEKKYYSPLFNKNTLELSDFKNSTRSPLSLRPVLSSSVTSKVIEKNTNSFNDNIYRFTKMNGNAKLDPFLQTYDRIVNSIRLGFGNNHLIPKKKRIIFNNNFKNDLTTDKINNKHLSLNASPCITMKPIVKILLKSVEVVINEKTKPNDNNLEIIEDNKKPITELGITETPQPPPSNVITSLENNKLQSEDITENNVISVNEYKDDDGIDNRDDNIVKSSTEVSDDKESINSNILHVKPVLSLESFKAHKDESKVKQDFLLESDSFNKLYKSISRDISIIESITKSEKGPLESISCSQNDPSENSFIANQNIEVYDMDKDNIQKEEKGHNINGILFRTDSMSKLYKEIMNNKNSSADINTIDKTSVDKTLNTENPLKKEIHLVNPKNYSLSEVYSYSSNSNTPNHNLQSSKLLKNNHSKPPIPHQHYKHQQQYQQQLSTSSINNTNENENDLVKITPQFNPPVKILRRSSSLGSRKDLSKRYDPPPTHNLENKNGIKGLINKQKRYSIDNIKLSTNIELLQLPNSNNSTNIDTINDFKNTNIYTEVSNTNDNKNKLPNIPKRSTQSKKHQSLNIEVKNDKQNHEIVSNSIQSSQNNLKDNNNNNNNNNNNVNNLLPNNLKDYLNNTNNKRYTVNMANLNRINTNNNVNSLPTTPKRSPDNSLRNKTPTPKYSSNISRSSISPLSFEIPAKPDNIVKHKSSRLSKTFSYFKSLSPRRSSSSQSLNKKESKNDLVLPSRILFEDEDSSSNSSKNKNKLFSISKLKNKIIKNTSKDNNNKSNKNNRDYRHSIAVFDLSNVQPYNNSSLEPSNNKNPSPIPRQNKENNQNSNMNVNHSVVRRISHPLIQRTNIKNTPFSSFEENNNSSNLTEIDKQGANKYENQEIKIQKKSYQINNQEISHQDDQKIKNQEINGIQNQKVENIENNGLTVEKIDEEKKKEMISNDKKTNNNEILEDDNNEEWIDEIDYNNNENSNGNDNNNSDSPKKSVTKNKSIKNYKKKNTQNIKYNNSVNRGRNTPKHVEVGHLSVKKGHSNGSIRYRRSTNKYTVIKTIRSPTPGSPPFTRIIPPNSPPFLRSPILSSSPIISTEQVTPNEFISGLHQPNLPIENVNLCSPQFKSPNCISSVPKGDISFSSISALSIASKASSVKLKRNIIKKFFHINLRKKQNKKSQKNIKKLFKGNYFSYD